MNGSRKFFGTEGPLSSTLATFNLATSPSYWSDKNLKSVPGVTSGYGSEDHFQAMTSRSEHKKGEARPSCFGSGTT